jgi:hypothetical protein
VLVERGENGSAMTRGRKDETIIDPCGHVAASAAAILERKGFMRKLTSLLALGVAAALGFAGTAKANTIQPILKSISGPVAGSFTYVFDLQLTPNNGLSSNATHPSSLTIFDFGVVSTATVSAVAGDVTAAADWTPSTALSGSSLPNMSINTPSAGQTTLFGDSNSVTANDSTSLSNVTVRYGGATLASSASQRSLINLTVVSSLVPGAVLQSLSMNTALGTINQADTFPVVTSAVPVPAAAWAGLSMLGSMGVLSVIRKRRSA